MNIAQGMSQPLAGSAQVDLSKLPHTTATPPLGGNQSPEVRNGVAVVIPQQPQHQRQPDQGLHRSPVRQQGAEGQGHNPADTEQYGKIAKLMREADANIVRQIVRDQWEKCLTGSDYHSAFILNASMRKASPGVMEHIAKHFSPSLMSAAKGEMLSHLQDADFDAYSDLVLSKVTNQFLDKALARRLETIEAQVLVNALARAERLGYDVQDIVERQPGGPEQVYPSVSWTMPSHPPPPQQHPQHPQYPQHPQHPQHQQQPPPPPPPQMPPSDPPGSRRPPPVRNQAAGPTLDIPAGSGISCCRRCHRPCSGEPARLNHEKKEACNPKFTYEMLGKTACFHCGVSFGSNGGVVYHIRTQVCGDYNLPTIRIMQGLLRTHIAGRDGGQPPRPVVVAKQQAAPAPSPSTLPKSALMVNNDQYSHLTLKKRQEYEAEAAAAEAKYGELMREAHKMQEPRRTEQLQKLKNSYNTKQSTTRKKYGIRIVKRTKEEMDAERIRLFQSPDGPEIYNGIGLVLSTSVTTLKRTAPEDLSASTQASSRPRTEEPRQRVPLEQMGGLGASSASVETADPTAYLTSSQPRGFAQMQQAQASPRKKQPATNGATQGEPMELSSSSEGSSGEDGEDGDDGEAGEEISEESSDDEDIPAR